MKKFFKFALMAFAVVAVSAAFVSCGDDADEVKPSSGDNNTTTEKTSYSTSINTAYTKGDSAAVSQIMQHICTKIGTGCTYSEVFQCLLVEASAKDKVVSTLTTLNNDVTWADNICKECGSKKVVIMISVDGNEVFKYNYPRVEPTGTWTGTENDAAWKIVFTSTAKENPKNEGAKKATVTVPEGMEIEAGEYTGEWFISITGSNYFYSDKFYGDEYKTTKTYVSLLLSPNDDGTCTASIRLRYPKEDGTTLTTKIHSVPVTKN